MCVRRLLDDLADNGYPVRDALILNQDFPPRDLYLPIPLAPEADAILNDQLRRDDDLLSNALLLIRATGMRVGECLRLNRAALRHLGENQWALHVPLGKLHNERWVPVDEDARRIFDRILSLVGPPPEQTPDPGSCPLLLSINGTRVTYHRISAALKKAAKRAGCLPVRLHQLRHTYATAMLRAGISITALKEILGHKDIRMTMGYIQVTQKDLQREYHSARAKMTAVHNIPQLPTKHDLHAGSSRIVDICRTLDAASHQLEMYRRHVSLQSANNKL
jgi:site-specific recombinase XerD